MRLKDSTVNLEGVSWRMFHAAVITEGIFKKRGLECIITSANDGKHGLYSLHPKGLALDIRTWALNGREPEVVAEMQEALGPGYDVVLEKDHIHLEWDEKNV